MSRDPLARVRLRPTPADWADDDQMTLREAVAVFWPIGPLTIASLRTEIANGRLTPGVVAGKQFITPAQIRALFRPAPCPDRPLARGSISDPAGSTPAPGEPCLISSTSETERRRSAQASALIALEKLRPPSAPGDIGLDVPKCLI